MVPIQEAAMVTRDARKTPWGLIAALSLEGTAGGSLYVDDGESLVQANGTLFVEVCVFFFERLSPSVSCGFSLLLLLVFVCDGVSLFPQL